MKKYLAFILILALVLCQSGCAAEVEAYAELLTPEDAVFAPEDLVPLTDSFYSYQNELGWKLFRATAKESRGENTLISPLSIQVALCMTANGADGNTLAQMEDLFCGELDMEAMNAALATYLTGLPSSEKAKLHIANSIWYRGGEVPLNVHESFLDTCARYYKAQAYQAPFNQQTIDDMNGWVKKHTDGMIPKLIDQLGPEAAMVLMNALCFDAKWSQPYMDTDVEKDIFTALDGSKQDAEYLCGSFYSYLEVPGATGFVQNYAEGGYKFAALLPNEGVDLYDFIENLSAEDVFSALNDPKTELVNTWLPKFTADYGISLEKMLAELGMSDAFDGNLANFSRMSDTPLCISEVIHKTHIQVDENGTKAAAATAVIMKECAAMPMPDCHYVRLDRPFVYMILDSNNVPLFIGVITELN